MIKTFDIFETCLVRRVADPQWIHWLNFTKMKPQVSLEIEAAEYVKQRMNAERAARNHSANEEVTLSEIFEHLRPVFGEEHCDQLLAGELETEESNLVTVPACLNRVAELRNAGNQIVFVSDMYLPEAFVKRQLEKYGFWVDGDRIYVSSSTKKLKLTGSMYSFLLEAEKANPGEIEHFGNDHHSDFLNAKQAGLKATFLNDGNLNRLERAWAEESIVGQRIAATARIARLKEQINWPVEQSSLCELYSSFAAPVLFLYVSWLLQRARNAGVKKLFFLARDGQLLKYVADCILESSNHFSDMQTGYLYGSRRAWYPLGIKNVVADRQFIDAVIRDEERTLDVVLGVFEIDKDEVQETLNAAGIQTDATVLDEKQYLDLLQECSDNPVLSLKCQQFLSEKVRTIDGYLRQAGMFESSVAIVDTGWTGLWQETVSNYVCEQTGEPVKTFLFGLYDSKVSHAKGDAISAFLFDAKKGLGDCAPPPFVPRLVEMFLPADHGLTLGYKELKGKFEPVLGETVESGRLAPMFRSILKTYVATMMCVQKNEQIMDRIGESTLGVRCLVLKLIYELWNGVTTLEVEALNQFSFNESVLDCDEKPTISPYSLREAIRVGYQYPFPLHPHHWHMATLKASSPATQFAFRVTRKLFASARAVKNVGR